MKVAELINKLELNKLTGAAADKEITGVYAGDLLSIVMSKCSEGDAWITCQTHQNILSVADLNDAACIIVTGGMAVDKSLVEKAEELGVVLCSTDMETYELAWKIHEVL